MPITTRVGDTDQVVGFTCPDCPTDAEPIRREVGKKGTKFKATVDVPRDPTGKRRQRVARCSTLADARAFVQRVRSGEDQADRETETVEHLAERWVRSRRDIRQVTREGYHQQLSPVVRYLGQREVSSLKVADILSLIAFMEQKGGRRGQALGPRSIRAAMIAIRQALDLAVDEGLLTDNVARSRSVRLTRARQAVGRDLTHWQPSELIAFVEHASSDAFAGAWRLTVSGMTRADVLGLRWSDLDLDAGTATISQGRVALVKGDAADDPKSAARRRVVPFESMWPGSVTLLRSLRRQQAADRLKAGSAWAGTDYVVVDTLGQPLRPEVYSDRFRRLASAAEVPAITLHSVRHSLAFWLHSIGVSPADAAALLGHTVEVHLSTYLPHSGASGIASAAAALARAAAK